MFLNTDFLTDGEIKLQLEKTVDAIPEKEWLPAYHFAICDMNGQIMGNVISESVIAIRHIMAEILDIRSVKNSAVTDTQ